MEAQPGIVGPASYPIPDPRNPKQQIGRCVNPPTYMGFGGLDKPSKWMAEHNTSQQASYTHQFPVERATDVKGAIDTTERKAS